MTKAKRVKAATHIAAQVPPTSAQPSAMAPVSSVARPAGFGQVVLVLQGGGALGAYQAGVYQALHESGVEPDWVIGTSIGAINAALIAGNVGDLRLERLRQFWSLIESPESWFSGFGGASGFGAFDAFDVFGTRNSVANLNTVLHGIAGFFEPNPNAMLGARFKVGAEQAAYYRTDPLRKTLATLIDFSSIASSSTRLTVGAVNACSGAMRYFDSRNEALGVEHILASGALPPAFPAVRIGSDLYWDGGIYSNTPIEAVLDDFPRRSSLIFAVNVWHQAGPEPESIWDVMGRTKDIQYASRADSHIAKQKELHRMRHIIRELTAQLTTEQRLDPHIKELAYSGCGTTMHVAHLVAPRLEGEDTTKDIDFTSTGVKLRRDSGYTDTMRMIERSPWLLPADPIEGVIEYRL
jgi:NTE family protein